MNGELKKWNVWLPEKRICQVEARFFEIVGTRAIFFNMSKISEEVSIYGIERFVCADFPVVYGVIEATNNSVAGIAPDSCKATTEQIKP